LKELGPLTETHKRVVTALERHLSPWIGRFFADLEQAQAADFYRHVGALGRAFVNIETEAFALSS
jgi:TorA maturation chaperone TorD